MRKYIAVILVLISLHVHSQKKLNQEKRSSDRDRPGWSVEHSISTRYLLTDDFADSIVSKMSNDGKYFVFASKRGDLSKDQNNYTFHFFETGKVLKALDLHTSKEKFTLEPLKKIEVTTNYLWFFYDSCLKWSEDNNSLVFFCIDVKNALLKLLSINIKEGSIKEVYSYGYQDMPTKMETIVGVNKDASTIVFKYNKNTLKDIPTYSESPEIPLNTDELTSVIFNYNFATPSTCCFLYYKGKVKELPFNVEPLPNARIIDALWNNDETEFSVTYERIKSDTPRFTIIYSRKGNQWVQSMSPVTQPQKINAEAVPSNNFKLQIHQDINTPPMMVATNGRNEIYLTEPDTALANVYIAPTKTIKWKVADGREFKGGLTLPKGYKGEKPLPLVIQSYEYSPNVFLPDGVSTSGYAMQSLVANGFAVLQMSIASSDLDEKYGNPRIAWEHNAEEGPDYVEKIDRVVAMLSEQGIVNKDKVGLIGFSRAGYEALLAVTNPGKIKLAAAMDLDGWTGSYYNYLLIQKSLINNPASTYRREWENNYSGVFWKNKTEWLKQEPSFNAERVNTPILFSVHPGRANNVPEVSSKVLSYSAILGALNLNNKPYEFLVYPKASHDLKRPQQIYAAIHTTIDWMSFWLKGVEDPDPAKGERYKHWRELKRIQDTVSVDKK